MKPLDFPAVFLMPKNGGETFGLFYTTNISEYCLMPLKKQTKNRTESVYSDSKSPVLKK